MALQMVMELFHVVEKLVMKEKNLDSQEITPVIHVHYNLNGQSMAAKYINALMSFYKIKKVDKLKIFKN